MDKQVLKELKSIVEPRNVFAALTDRLIHS
jgi:hypothetical protein